jgi:hypothetical protein
MKSNHFRHAHKRFEAINVLANFAVFRDLFPSPILADPAVKEEEALGQPVQATSEV